MVVRNRFEKTKFYFGAYNEVSRIFRDHACFISAWFGYASVAFVAQKLSQTVLKLYWKYELISDQCLAAHLF